MSNKETKPHNQDHTKDRARHHAELMAGLANRRRRTESRAVTCDEPDAYSIEEFCRKHRISIQVFYKRPDLMPDSFYVGTRRLISVESAARWRRKREQLAQFADTETPKIEHQAVDVSPCTAPASKCSSRGSR